MDKNQPPSLHRRSIRLPGYDYSEEGSYFVTICSYNLGKIFGEIVNGEMKLTEFGKIAYDQWMKIPERFGNVELDEFVVMPNHVHGILILMEMDGHPKKDGHPHLSLLSGVQRSRQGVPVRAGLAPAPKLGDIVGAYKSLVANECLKIYKARHQLMGKLWLRNYYEYIICSDKEYENIAEYIELNPLYWGEKDEFYR